MHFSEKYTRLTVSIPNELHSTIDRLAKAQGRAKSKVIVELLEGLEPSLKTIASTLEAVRHMEKGTQAELQHSLQGLADKYTHMAAQADADLKATLKTGGKPRS